MKELRSDVCIIGNGPAACTIALIMSRRRFSTTMIGLPYSNNILVVETLKPDIKEHLVHLGIWPSFLEDDHLQSAGNMSIWGEKTIRENNFVFHPHSHGWHINRQKFNNTFLNSAKREGTEYTTSRIERVKENFDGTFEVKLLNANNTGTSLNLAS